MQREERKSGNIMRNIEERIQTEGDSDGEVGRVAVDETVLNVDEPVRDCERRT